MFIERVLGEFVLGELGVEEFVLGEFVLVELGVEELVLGEFALEASCCGGLCWKLRVVVCASPSSVVCAWCVCGCSYSSSSSRLKLFHILRTFCAM